ncbi:MAG: 3-oxoadipate enol-lactonase [Alphaproteobacteria bacterium]|nr:3-oxoadipate enol-lactonase [Alphaproteobacteria bacterium]
MRTRVGDIEVDYAIDGPTGAPVVTLVHSLATSHHAWAEIAAGLQTDFRVLRYSLRGHGDTEATPGPYSIEQLADDLAGLLDVLDIGRSHIVGLSIGGMIGQSFAVRHPDRLARLIICSSLAELPDGASAIWQARIDAAREQGMQAQAAGTIERWFTPDFRTANKAVPDAVCAMIAATSLDGYLGCCAAIGTMHLTPHLATVTAPTLVLVGSDDAGTPPAAARIIAAAIPGAELGIIEGVSHQMALQEPEIFTGSVRDFLRGPARMS